MITVENFFQLQMKKSYHSSLWKFVKTCCKPTKVLMWQDVDDTGIFKKKTNMPLKSNDKKPKSTSFWHTSKRTCLKTDCETDMMCLVSNSHTELLMLRCTCQSHSSNEDACKLATKRQSKGANVLTLQHVKPKVNLEQTHYRSKVWVSIFERN